MLCLVTGAIGFIGKRRIGKLLTSSADGTARFRLREKSLRASLPGCSDLSADPCAAVGCHSARARKRSGDTSICRASCEHDLPLRSVADFL